MTNDTTRRAFLGAGAATLASAVPAVALASTPDVSSELQALVARIREAAAQADAAADAYEAAVRAMGRTPDPERPAALYVHHKDWNMGLPHPVTPSDWRPGDPIPYDCGTVAKLRAEPRTRPDYSAAGAHDGSVTMLPRLPDPQAQARADEIVSAWDGWWGALMARREAFDLPRLGEAEETAVRLHGAALSALAAMPARTLPAAVLKARVLADMLGDGFDVWAGEEVDDFPEALARSLVRDLARLDLAQAAPH